AGGGGGGGGGGGAVGGGAPPPRSGRRGGGGGGGGGRPRGPPPPPPADGPRPASRSNSRELRLRRDHKVLGDHAQSNLHRAHAETGIHARLVESRGGDHGRGERHVHEARNGTAASAGDGVQRGVERLVAKIGTGGVRERGAGA